jgi:hypothetical protein
VKCLPCNIFDVITHGIVFVSLDYYNNNVTILLWFLKKYVYHELWMILSSMDHQTCLDDEGNMFLIIQVQIHY